MAVLTQDPPGELVEDRVLGHEHVALEPAGFAVHALDPPRGVVADLDPRLADDVADLPGRPAEVLVDVELGGDPEVALPTRREPDGDTDASSSP